MGILSGSEIARCVGNGDIEISPFDSACINPASYDLHLGDEVVQYKYSSLDSAEDNEVYKTHIRPERGHQSFHVRPGALYLMHTVERIKTTRYVPVIDGKSSIGRLGVCVHITAGYGDPGFDGQYTLEVTSMHVVRLYVGMRIAQIRFHEMVGNGPPYKGNYTEERATGAVASRSWAQKERT